MRNVGALVVVVLLAACSSSPRVPVGQEEDGQVGDAPGADVALPDAAVPPQTCGIGAPANVASSAGITQTGATAGFASISACGDVTTSSVLTADLTGDCSCLTIKADGVTIEGAGHTITMTGGICSGEGPLAILTTKNNGTVRNVRSNAPLRSYGASKNTFEHNDVGGVSLYSGSSHAIRDNKMHGGVAISGEIAPIDHVTMTGNFIEGTGAAVVDVSGGTKDPCPATEHTIDGNVIVNLSTTFAPVDGGPTKGLYLRCARKNRITNNVIETQGYGQAMRLRDEADFNVIEHNTLWVGSLGPGDAAFKMSSGNVDKTFPASNTIRYNLVISEINFAIDIQGSGGQNTFAYDVFWAKSGDEGARLASNDGDIYDHDTFVHQGSHAVVLDTLAGSGITFTNDVIARFGVATGSQVIAFDHAPTLTAFSGGGNVYFDDRGPATFWTYDFSAWRANAPKDLGSKEGNPKLADLAQGDFRLGAGSAAKGAGISGTDSGAFPASCLP